MNKKLKKRLYHGVISEKKTFTAYWHRKVIASIAGDILI